MPPVRTANTAPISKTPIEETGVLNEAKKINGNVKRPPNAFMLYRTEMDPVVRRDNPKMRAADVCSAVAKLWKAEPESVKQVYRQRSEALNEQHKKDHPDFKWVTRSSQNLAKQSKRRVKPESQRFIRKDVKPVSVKVFPLFQQLQSLPRMLTTCPSFSSRIRYTSPELSLLHASEDYRSPLPSPAISDDPFPSPALDDYTFSHDELTRALSENYLFEEDVEFDDDDSTIDSDVPSAIKSPIDDNVPSAAASLNAPRSLRMNHMVLTSTCLPPMKLFELNTSSPFATDTSPNLTCNSMGYRGNEEPVCSTPSMQYVNLTNHATSDTLIYEMFPVDTFPPALTTRLPLHVQNQVCETISLDTFQEIPAYSESDEPS